MRRLLAISLLAACGGSDDPMTTPDAITTPDAPMVSLDTPANTWTWVEVPGTKCANGTPAGFGINRSTVSGDLFVYFQGGGACWDGQSCFVDKTAVHVETTYDAAVFASEIGNPTVNHADPVNPLAPATFIFVPYCTGDLHAGQQTKAHDVGGTPRSVAHVGATNTQTFVDVLRGAFPDATKVWLAGSSAGGYGATLNHHRFVGAWPTAGVHTLQDGSPLLTPRVNFGAWRTSWDLQYPPGCTGCDADFGKVMDTLATTYPMSRFGLLHYDDDAVIKAYFGYPAQAGSMVADSNALVDTHYVPHANTKAFMLAGQGHTMLFQGNPAGNGGTTLNEFVFQWATGAATWATVRPAR